MVICNKVLDNRARLAHHPSTYEIPWYYLEKDLLTSRPHFMSNPEKTNGWYENQLYVHHKKKRNRKFILTEQCIINDFNIIKGDLPYFSTIKVVKKETIC